MRLLIEITNMQWTHAKNEESMSEDFVNKELVLNDELDTVLNKGAVGGQLLWYFR